MSVHDQPLSLFPAKDGDRAVYVGDDGDIFEEPLLCWAICKRVWCELDKNGQLRTVDAERVIVGIIQRDGYRPESAENHGDVGDSFAGYARPGEFAADVSAVSEKKKYLRAVAKAESEAAMAKDGKTSLPSDATSAEARVNK